MSKKINKKQAVLDYIKENPNAKNSEVAKACGVHPTYASLIKRNGKVKTPKKAKPDFGFKQTKKLNELRNENAVLRGLIIRLDAVIKYLQDRLDGASVRG